MLCVSAQRVPQGFQALLQRFEGWFLERVYQQPGFLEALQVALYNAAPAPVLEAFQQEVADQLSQGLHAVEEPLPYALLRELQNGGFWKQYVCGWLLSLTPAPADPPLPGPEAVQGNVTAISIPINSLVENICSR